MKKKKWMALAMMLVLILFAACDSQGKKETAAESGGKEAAGQENTGSTGNQADAGQNQADAAESTENQADAAESVADGTENQADATESQADGTENQAAGTESQADATENQADTGSAAETENTEELTIYYSNQSADGLESERVETGELTPEIIVSNLARHNIVSIDTKVNRFEVEEEKDTGRKVLTLDLSKAFGEYIGTMGTGGETVIIAAITNTFLEAYQADALKLLVEGKPLETGHAVYEEELNLKNAAVF